MRQFTRGIITNDYSCWLSSPPAYIHTFPQPGPSRHVESNHPSADDRRQRYSAATERGSRRNPGKLISADFGSAAAGSGSETKAMVTVASCIRMTTAARPPDVLSDGAVDDHPRRRPPRAAHSIISMSTGKVPLNVRPGATDGHHHQHSDSSPATDLSRPATLCGY